MAGYTRQNPGIFLKRVDFVRWDPLVTYVDSRFDESSTLASSALKGAFAPGMFGPNFEFAAGPAVPEPTTLAMGVMPIIAAAGTISRRRFRRKESNQ